MGFKLMKAAASLRTLSVMLLLLEKVNFSAQMSCQKKTVSVPKTRKSNQNLKTKPNRKK